MPEYYPGAEAGVRYARLLNRSDQRPLAQQTLKALLDRAKFAPAHYRKAQREWLDEAHRELQKPLSSYFLRLMERNETPSIIAL